MQDENMTTSANPNTDSAQSVKPIPTSNTIADPIAPSKSPIQSSGGNTSGQGSSAVVPEEVKGWSWGGFFFTWIWWGLFNGWSSLLVVIIPQPFINVILGVKGRELAWQNKRWESVEQFKLSQRKWDIAGVVWLVISLVILIIIVIELVAINPVAKIQEFQDLQEQQQFQQEENSPTFEFSID